MGVAAAVTVERAAGTVVPTRGEAQALLSPTRGSILFWGILGKPGAVPYGIVGVRPVSRYICFPGRISLLPLGDLTPFVTHLEAWSASLRGA